MSRLNIFKENEKYAGMYKDALASLGFRTGATPSSKEIDEAYAERQNFLSRDTILNKSYDLLQQPLYRYERVYERIQHQYLLKQYDILYRYYHLLKRLDINKNSENLLKSIEDEYEKCLNDIRNIETESNIVAEIVIDDYDKEVKDKFISDLENRDIKEEFDIDDIMLNTKLEDLKQKINDLYYEKSSKNRLDIKQNCLSKTSEINKFTNRFPSTEHEVARYLNEYKKTIILDDVDLKVRREKLNDISLLSDFLTHSVNGSPDANLVQLSNKIAAIKKKIGYIMKLKGLNSIKLFKKDIFTIYNDKYIQDYSNYKTDISKLKNDFHLYTTFINIISSIVDRKMIKYEDATYLDGLLNNFDNYLNKLNSKDEQIHNIDSILSKEKGDISFYRYIKERSIYEYINQRYMSLSNLITSYYAQLSTWKNQYTPVTHNVIISRLLSNYKQQIEDSSTSLKDKLAIIDYMESFANNYCNDTNLKQQSISK